MVAPPWGSESEARGGEGGGGGWRVLADQYQSENTSGIPGNPKVFKRCARGRAHMKLFSVKPNYFTLRNDAEKTKLIRVLRALGLTLTPLSKKETIDLWKEVIDEELTGTESYSDESDESAEELPNDDHPPRAHTVAGSHGG